jgi:hypothetical protein
MYRGSGLGRLFDQAINNPGDQLHEGPRGSIEQDHCAQRRILTASLRATPINHQSISHRATQP